MTNDDAKRKELLAGIEAIYPAAMAGDYLALLGVSEDDPSDAMKGAFFKKARIYHPDVLARHGLDPRDLEKGRFVCKKLSEAYNTLTDKARRATYLAKMRMGKAGQVEEPKRSAEEEAEILYHKAQILLRRGHHRAAIVFLRRALKHRGDEVRYLLDLGWTIFNDPNTPLGERLEEALQYFDKVLDKQSNHSQATFYKALYYKAKNQTEEAYALLRDCLTIDPHFTPARRELRLLRLRIKKENERMKNPFYRLKKMFGGGDK